MKNPFEMKCKINTLTICANGMFTEEEMDYLKALNYVIEQFEGIPKDYNTLCLNLNDGNFLIANHNSDYNYNPLAFVNKKGEISYIVNISVFSVQIQEFQKYINYMDSKEERDNWPYRKKVIAAIKEYKNDILDFHISKNLVSNKLLEEARMKYEQISSDLEQR